MTQSMIDVQIDALKTHYSNGDIYPKYEIDKKEDGDFGDLWRIWHGFYLVGTFYEDVDGYWIPQPVKSDYRPRVKSELHAQLILIAVYENPALQTE